MVSCTSFAIYEGVCVAPCKSHGGAQGLQLILVNPISLALYAWGLHFFFSTRINYEGKALIEDIFGAQYTKYREKTSTMIPFIK